MGNKIIDCFIVRDLLPYYVEDLTEPETTKMIKEHLAECAACSRLEADMRSSIPLEKPPQRALGFLKRVRKIKLIGVVITLIIMILLIWWCYDKEYHYANTEAGVLLAIEDFIKQSDYITDDTSIELVGWEEKGDHLFALFMAKNEDCITGSLFLKKGWNGKYMIDSMMLDTSEYKGGIYGAHIIESDVEAERDVFYIMGYNCREIYAAEITFYGHYDYFKYDYTEEETTSTKRIELSGNDFVYTFSIDELLEELDWDDMEIHSLEIARDIKLFDKDGEDITEKYMYEPENDFSQICYNRDVPIQSFQTYMHIGHIVLIGLMVIAFFLYRE